MPRAEAKSSASASASSSPYPSPSSTASTAASRGSTASDASSGSTAAKKKHVCSQCNRAFTTSGHLARHTRVHTGERNHKCPFPGCETRCSRQDNLQQHYRIHLSPGSRRVSGRALKLKRASQIAQPPMTTPLILQPATRSPPPPPNTPPPLEQAPLTALVVGSPSASSSSGMLSASRGNSSSPDGPFSSQYMASTSPAATPSYGYRNPAYQSASSYDYFSVPAAHQSYGAYVEDCDGRYDVRQAYDTRQAYDQRSSWGNRPSPGYDGRASSMTNTFPDGSSRHSLSYIAPAYRAEPRRDSLPLSAYSGAPSPTSTDSADSSPTTPAFPYTDGTSLVAHGMVAAADDYGKPSVPVEQPVPDYQKPAYPYTGVYDQPSPAYDDPAPCGVPDARAALVLPPLEGRAQYQPRSASYTQRIDYMNSDRAHYVQSMDRTATYAGRDEYVGQHGEMRAGYPHPYDMSWKAEGPMRGRLVDAYAQ